MSCYGYVEVEDLETDKIERVYFSSDRKDCDHDECGPEAE